MLQKITLGLLVVLVILGVIGLVMIGGMSHQSLGYSGAGTTLNSIQLTPSSTQGDLYALGWNTFANRWTPASATILVDLNGNWAGNILQTGLSSNAKIQELDESVAGFAQTISTSTTLTPTQQCLASNVQITGTSALATTTFAAATSTYAVCGTANGGPFSIGLVTNDSTNTVSLVAGTGDTLKYMTEGSATSTVLGGTASLPSGTVAMLTGEFDTSSTLYILVGPTWK